MSFLQRQRLRILKEVAFHAGKQSGPAAHAASTTPTLRWQVDSRTGIVVGIALIVLTVISVWGAMADTPDTPDTWQDGRTQAEKLLGDTPPRASGEGDDAQEYDTPSSGTIKAGKDLENAQQETLEQTKTGWEQRGRGAKHSFANKNGQHTDTSTQGKVIIHVAGAVAHPGVVEAHSHTRVFEAVELAGGATEQAELSAVNLATQVKDGDYIYIPTKEETQISHKGEGPSAPRNFGATENAQALSARSDTAGPRSGAHCIDINAASAPALEELPGVGPALAQRIVEYREQNGPFSRVADLDSVSGIGQKLIHRIEDSVCQ